MDLHVVSRACHHPNGLVHFSKGSDDMSGHIVGISKPSNKEPEKEITKGLVLDVELLDRVFKVPITTVKCIPHGCRLAFSQTLKTLLCKLVAQPDSVNAWVSYILKSLATRGKDDGITTLVKSILDGSALGSFGQGKGDFLEEGPTGNTNIKQCLRKVTDGHLMTAVKVLSSSGVAPYCDDTIKTLEAKHPYKPPSSMPNITFSKSPLVKVSGNAEAVLHRVNRVLSEYHNDGSLAMLTVDFSNAFNLVDRSALLHEVVRVLDIIKAKGPGLGLELNIKKTEIFWPSCNGIKLRDGLFLVDIRIPSSGVKLFGGAVSRAADFISGLAMRRAANAVDLLSLLSQLHDPQSELLLLQSCMGISKLFLGLRTSQPVHMEKSALFFDKGLRGSIENIVVCGGPFFGDL
ncbi:hypothetical protein Tco_0336852 [Tanacetum coccineum]